MMDGFTDARHEQGSSHPSLDAFRRASALHDASRFGEAEAVLRSALAEDPANANLLNARGVMFAAMGRHLDALWCYRDAVAHNPDDPGVWTNLGNTLTHLKHLKSAVHCHQRALGLARPGGEALLYQNLGVSLAEAGMHGDAVVAFTRALEIDPARNAARWDRARSYLYLGNYHQGFADYEIRQFTGQLPPKQLSGELWRGQPYAGKRLLLLVEQGFGDTIWAARYLAVNGKRRLLGSFWHGSMANAMSQAIGAQAAYPQRQVISLSGDGGFTMLMGDLLSLSQLKLPVKVIVFNNGALGFIELEQKSSGFLDTGTELVNPNFAAMAEAVGIKGIRIEDPADVQGKLAEALAHPGPVVVDAVVNRMELAMPPKVTTEMAKGFTLYMVKAVLNGRVDQVIELAQSNLRR